jgi:branched-chain amino acid transport system permease protein
MFGIGVSVQALIVNLVGGIGHPVGPLLGTLIVVPISQVLDAKFGAISGASQLVYGMVLMAVVLLIPRGLIDELRRVDSSGRPWLAGLQTWLSRRHLNVSPPASLAAVPRETPDGSPAKGAVMLTANGLSKSYGGVVALQNFSLDDRHSRSERRREDDPLRPSHRLPTTDRRRTQTGRPDGNRLGALSARARRHPTYLPDPTSFRAA